MTRKDDLKTITIIHPADRVYEYRWLSGFFRLIGIWVCENIAGDIHGDLTDIYIQIEKPGQIPWSNITWKMGNDDEYRPLDMDNCKAGNIPTYEESNWVSEILRAIQEFFYPLTYAELQQIAVQYVKWDLMRCSYAIQYFGDTQEFEIYKYMASSKCKVVSALEQLQAKKTERSSKYYLAALSNCQRRHNELYTIIWNACQNKTLEGQEREFLYQELKQSMYQSYDTINRHILRILELDSEFYGAYAIRGFVKYVDANLVLESGYDFMTAVNMCGNKSYASYILYRIGNYFEIYRKEPEEEKKYYQQAYDHDNHNYRAIYKLAIYYKRRKQYKNSLKFWEELLAVLEGKKKMESLQPIECAYLYKAFYNIGLIYTDMKEYERAVIALEEAMKFENRNKNQPFYNWMFGPCGEKFKQAAVKKLNLADCQENLSNVYRMRGF